MTSFEKMALSILAAGVLAVVVAAFYEQKKTQERVTAVQNGDAVLNCHIGDGYIDIDPSKVDGLIDGRWVFTNGSASQCVFLEASR